ncbi:MAG: hypothetical protein WC397_03735 [Candidatus Paceibacterota bacterium]
MTSGDSYMIIEKKIKTYRSIAITLAIIATIVSFIVVAQALDSLGARCQ